MGAEKIPKNQKHFNIFADFCEIPLQNFASGAFLMRDGPNDMTLAKNTGIFAIGITNTVSPAQLRSSGANLVISTFKDLETQEF
jgi:phosphoglycolate phosphatase-like HAD superfamily hydrolase